MPIVSVSGFLAAYIAFGRAKVWRTVVLLSFIFSPLAAQAMCADNVIGGPERNILMSATRFIDLEKLAQSPKGDLQRNTSSYLTLQLQLETELADIIDQNHEIAKVSTEKRDMAKFDDLSKRMMRARSELALVQDYLSLIDRISLKKFKFTATPLLQRQVVHPWSVDVQVMARTIDALKDLGKTKDQLIVRFIPIAKQDLTLEHGTDLYGQPFLDENENSSQGTFLNERIAVLKFNNLKMHDAFEGVTLAKAEKYRWPQTEHPIEAGRVLMMPHTDMKHFMNGEMAIAVYDVAQLEEPEDEYFIFKNTRDRKKALLRLIIPVKG